jgi:hypothetical protein
MTCGDPGSIIASTGGGVMRDSLHTFGRVRHEGFRQQRPSGAEWPGSHRVLSSAGIDSLQRQSICGSSCLKRITGPHSSLAEMVSESSAVSSRIRPVHDAPDFWKSLKPSTLPAPIPAAVPSHIHRTATMVPQPSFGGRRSSRQWIPRPWTMNHHVCRE